MNLISFIIMAIISVLVIAALVHVLKQGSCPDCKQDRCSGCSGNCARCFGYGRESKKIRQAKKAN